MYETELSKLIASRGLAVSPGMLPEQGNLNTVRFVQDEKGRSLVLRRTNDLKHEDITDYLDALYDRMGLYAYGGHLRLRTVQEQVQVLESFFDTGVCVPRVVDSGPDWILMSRMEGDPLKTLLASGKRNNIRKPIESALSAVMDVHAKGLYLWDRWGANELVDKDGQVSFIDFDIAVVWPEAVSSRVRAAFDLSILIRGCVQFSSDKRISGNLVLSSIYRNVDFEDIYNTEAMVRFLEGQTCFYNDRYCRNINTSLENRLLHESTNAQISRLCLAIRSFSSSSPHFSCNFSEKVSASCSYPHPTC